jgi:NADPH:quinone reductase-like Zn-dependent oxidoreductase
MPLAIIEHEFGAADVLHLEEEALPQLRPDEVAVRVYAAGVNPVDAFIRKGMMKDSFPVPLIPGCEIAGVVERVGNKVFDFRKDDEVYGMIGFTGGYAEYAVTKESYLAPKPETLDFTFAAAVPLAALAAWQSLFELGALKAGQRILIHGAAGGVGGFAVQFANNIGAYVIGTAAKQDSEYLWELGASEVIDYKAVRFEEAVGDVDFVLDLIGGDTQDRSWAVLKNGGTLVTSKNPPSEEKARQKNAVAKTLLVHPDGKQLSEIKVLIDACRVRVTVSEVFPLKRASQAHLLLESGNHTRGKIVLQI